MKQLNKNIDLIGVELIAQSRVLLVKPNDTSKCLTVVISDGQAIPQDKLYDTQKVIGFNAFKEIETQDERESLKMLLTQQLSDSSIDQINKLLA